MCPKIPLEWRMQKVYPEVKQDVDIEAGVD